MKKTILTLIGFLCLLNIQAQVIDVLTNLNEPRDLLFNGDDMYFIDLTTLKKVDISQSTLVVETLFSGFDSGAGMTLKDEILYFTDFFGSQIWKIDISVDNPVAEVLVGGLNSPNMLAIKDNVLYYSDNNEQIIGKVILNVPNPVSTTFLSDVGNVIGIEIYGDELFYSTIASSSVYKVGLSEPNPSPEAIFSGITSPQGLSRCGSEIYLSSRNSDEILKFNPTCGPLSLQNVLSDVDEPRQTAIHNNYMYIIEMAAEKITKTPFLDITCGLDIQVSCSSFTWLDGITYISSTNTPTFAIPNAAGCDSVITLNLTITDSLAYYTDVQSACESFTWDDGITYTASTNSPSITYTLDSGCDSVVTLDLTINSSSSAVDIQSACEEYTWIDGLTYIDNNNTATFLLTNTNGCDSIITLDLSINEATVSTDIQDACDEYTWIDGVTYVDNNNTATFILSNSNGCDSTITLALTIGQVNTELTLSGNETLTASANGAIYQWLDCSNNFSPITGETNQSFVPSISGTYAVQVTENDCVDTSDCIELMLTGLDEINLFSDLSIYPNPTEGELVVDLGNLKNPELEVYTVLGELVAAYRTIEERQFSFQLDGLAGVYFVRVRIGEASRVFRVLKI